MVNGQPINEVHGVLLKWGGRSSHLDKAARIRRFQLSSDGQYLCCQSHRRSWGKPVGEQRLVIATDLEHVDAEIRRSTSAEVKALRTWLQRPDWCFGVRTWPRSSAFCAQPHVRELILFSTHDEVTDADAPGRLIVQLHSSIRAIVQGACTGSVECCGSACQPSSSPAMRPRGTDQLDTKTQAQQQESSGSPSQEVPTVPQSTANTPVSFSIRSVSSSSSSSSSSAASSPLKPLILHPPVCIPKASQVEMQSPVTTHAQVLGVSGLAPTQYPGRHEGCTAVNSSADPYCKVWLRTGNSESDFSQFETTVQVQTLSPRWGDAPFQATVSHNLCTGELGPFLRIEVWDRCAVQDDFLGYAELVEPPWLAAPEKANSFFTMEEGGAWHPLTLPLWPLLSWAEHRRGKTKCEAKQPCGQVHLQIRWERQSAGVESVAPSVSMRIADFTNPMSSLTTNQDVLVHGIREYKWGSREAVNDPNGLYRYTSQMHHGRPVYASQQGYRLIFWNGAAMHETGWWLLDPSCDKAFKALNADAAASTPVECAGHWKSPGSRVITGMTVFPALKKCELLQFADDWQGKVKELERQMREEVSVADWVQDFQTAWAVPPSSAHSQSLLPRARGVDEARPAWADIAALGASLLACNFLGSAATWAEGIYGATAFYALLLVMPVVALLVYLHVHTQVCACCATSCPEQSTTGRPIEPSSLDLSEGDMLHSLLDKFPDFHKASFLTSFLSLIWPHLVVHIGAPFTFVAGELHLGWRPPIILAVKVYDGTPIFIDLDVRWFAGVSYSCPRRMKLPIFHSVLVEMHLRVGLEAMIPIPPFIGSISFCLMEKPRIDIQWDLNPISMILQIVTFPLICWLLPCVLWSKLGWPRKVSKNLVAQEHLDQAIHGSLFVTVTDAGNFIQHDVGPCHRHYGLPFLEVRTASNSVVRQINYSKGNKCWHVETMRLDISDPRGKRVTFTLWRDSSCKGQPLGEASINLTKVVDIDGVLEKVFVMKRDAESSQKFVLEHDDFCSTSSENIVSDLPWLRLRLSWVNCSGQAPAVLLKALALSKTNRQLPYYVFVHLEQARNLLPAHSDGTSCPYCVLEVEDDFHRRGANLFGPQTSRTLQKTLNPVWRQDFTFIACGVHEARLHIYVFSRRTWWGLFSKKVPLGDATLSISELLRHHGSQEVSLKNTKGALSAVVISCSLGPVADRKIYMSRQ